MELDELNETYRDRFLNSFFASYSMIGVLEGIIVALAAIIRTPANSWMVDLVGVLAIVQIFLILVMFHLFRRTYNLLGFAPKDADSDPSHPHNTKAKNYANWAKKFRKVSELMVHFLLVVQIALLFTAWRVPATKEPNKASHATATSRPVENVLE